MTDTERKLLNSLPNQQRDDIKAIREAVGRAYEEWRHGAITDEHWETFKKLAEFYIRG